jgi:hypothetical protein
VAKNEDDTTITVTDNVKKGFCEFWVQLNKRQKCFIGFFDFLLPEYGEKI